MAVLTIKLCDLNEGDIGSFKSMFHLTQSQRQQEWEIVTSGDADLYIYSFESEKSITAWQNHHDGMSILFSTNADVDVAVDIVLKKPLRTKNFTAVLNEAAEQILSTKKDIEEQAKETITEPKPTVSDDVMAPEKKKESFINTLSSSISKRLTAKKPVINDKPVLTLALPEQSAIDASLIIESNILKESLSQENSGELIATLLENLIPLNRFIIPTKIRLSLLEVCRNAAAPLFHDWDTELASLKSLDHEDYLKLVQDLSLLIEELAIGYKILVMAAYNEGNYSKTAEPLLIAINRVAEYSNLHILHAYYFLRSTPSPSIHTLHQLYICCEAAEILEELPPKEDNDTTRRSFSSFYNQILLTAIADPYRLTQINVLKLYQLMAKYTSKIKIDLLTEEQKSPENDTLLVGHFFIDTESHTPPLSLDNISPDDRLSPYGRLLNTHATLTAIEIIFQQASLSIESDVYSSEIQLLKKIIPHINTSYERQVERVPADEGNYVQLVKDIADIHTSLASNTFQPDTKWKVHNHSVGGLMVSTNNLPSNYLDVGDFYGVFGMQNSPALAVVRWLQVTADNRLEMGLELHRGQPIAIDFSLENNPEEFPALILRSDNGTDTLMAPKAIISTEQALQITEHNKTYIITITKLIDDSFNYEHYSFMNV